VSLCENGVNPEALALVVKELRRESDALKVINNKNEHLYKHLFDIESRKNVKFKKK